METAQPLLPPPLRIAHIATRVVLVVLMLLMLPAGLMTYAAAGSTLSDPTDSYRVGNLVLAFLAFDSMSLMAVALFHARRWPWILAACIALTPIITLSRNAWL